jgi:ubiquinone/menaquinone biosynthesis C-methylase UbiE
LKEDEMERYWSFVALEAQDLGAKLRSDKWKKAARNRLADYADRRARDFVVEVVKKVIKLDRSARVLDVGCGPGKWSIMFAKTCSSVTAVDISPNMILLARKNAEKEKLENLDFHVMNVSRLDVADETYDLVNCVTVLQHMFDDDEWRKAVLEFARVTKKGGYILLFEVAPSFAVKKRTSNLRIRTMRQYANELGKVHVHLVYWRAVDLSLPITYLGLRNYAASFNKRVYYFISRRRLPTPGLLSFLSWGSALLARVIDYKLGETPLSYLSLGRILLFQKTSR